MNRKTIVQEYFVLAVDKNMGICQQCIKKSQLLELW